jgi:hypothetical protein
MYLRQDRDGSNDGLPTISFNAVVRWFPPRVYNPAPEASMFAEKDSISGHSSGSIYTGIMVVLRLGQAKILALMMLIHSFFIGRAKYGVGGVVNRRISISNSPGIKKSVTIVSTKLLK